jgi:hypothetical protein
MKEAGNAHLPAIARHGDDTKALREHPLSPPVARMKACHVRFRDNGLRTEGTEDDSCRPRPGKRRRESMAPKSMNPPPDRSNRYRGHDRGWGEPYALPHEEQGWRDAPHREGSSAGSYSNRSFAQRPTEDDVARTAGRSVPYYDPRGHAYGDEFNEYGPIAGTRYPGEYGGPREDADGRGDFEYERFPSREYADYPGYAPGAYGAYPDFDNEGRRGYGRRRSHGRHRGVLERTRDEIASLFGDEDAARRRVEDHRGRGPANYMRSDERIFEDACDNLMDDWAIDAREISVSVKEGEITLDGKVDSRKTKRRAEDLAEHVSGVRHVQNNLRVRESQE